MKICLDGSSNVLNSEEVVFLTVKGPGWRTVFCDHYNSLFVKIVFLLWWDWVLLFLKLNSVRTLERGILQHLSLSGAIVIVKKL